jgi:ergothioneine biosynthesis protein EgtB
MLNGPIPPVEELARMLRDARSRTLAYAHSLGADQLLGPRRQEVNPPLWEIGHIGWFQELWCLRDGGHRIKPLLPNADALYDSSCVEHGLRWDLPLPGIEDTLAYCERTLERVLERLERDGADADSAYFIQLATFHEDMHNEAFDSTRQALGYRHVRWPGSVPAGTTTGALNGDAEVPGGEFMMGAQLWDGFVFDNEKWAHPVAVKPFRIARAPVTCREFMAFVGEGGYTHRQWWSEQGWRWRERKGSEAPVYWQRDGGGWQLRWFERVVPLPLDAPVMCVSWHEAQAYCRWAGRRLPTEAEWEMAASTHPGQGAGGAEGRRRYPWGQATPDAEHANLYGAAGGLVEVAGLAAGDSAWGCRQMLGNVWEWTASDFLAYPGFVVDPYRDYSAPWFGSHKVLRGGCFATAPRLIRNTWRNFYTPERQDVFAGFRTCSLDD